MFKAIMGVVSNKVLLLLIPLSLSIFPKHASFVLRTLFAKCDIILARH